MLGVIEIFVNKSFKAQALVTKSERLSYPLIGRNIIERMWPSWRTEFLKQLSSVCQYESMHVNSTSDESSNNIYNRDEKISCDLQSKNRVPQEFQKYVTQIKSDFKEVFQQKETPIKRFKVKLELKPGAQPVFRKAAVPPYALREKLLKS